MEWMALILVMAQPDVPAFPGAEGFGKVAAGGRAGNVYVVTTLEDYGRRDLPIPGSLRAAVQTKGPRTIVFRTGGRIRLVERLVVDEPYLTIAGQTAPGDGICLTGRELAIRDTHDIVIRHLRVRPGTDFTTSAISIENSQRIMIDHCSMSWTVDDVLSIRGAATDDVTVQWCFITESLRDSLHPKGRRGMGVFLKAEGKVSLHRNLLAHHNSRNPRPGSYREEPGILCDFRNNVIYNWGERAGYSTVEPARINYIGNIAKAGPDSESRDQMFFVGGESTFIYVADNAIAGIRQPGDPWSLIENEDMGERQDVPFECVPITTVSPGQAWLDVLAGAGATVPKRDSVDARVVDEVRTGTGRIIDDPRETGARPRYEEGTPALDGDADGIPDECEEAMGLNPADPGDHAADADGDGYTNLEAYLNSL